MDRSPLDVDRVPDRSTVRYQGTAEPTRAPRPRAVPVAQPRAEPSRAKSTNGGRTHRTQACQPTRILADRVEEALAPTPQPPPIRCLCAYTRRVLLITRPRSSSRPWISEIARPRRSIRISLRLNRSRRPPCRSPTCACRTYPFPICCRRNAQQ